VHIVSFRWRARPSLETEILLGVGNVGAVRTSITDEMRAIVGVVGGEQTSHPIAASDIRIPSTSSVTI
jgi:hypothetical protein